ncbi:MAG: peptidase M28, partial [Proteobacteria bacterium]|nr:peptidase M28 [Pseudomonadota bacterium]
MACASVAVSGVALGVTPAMAAGVEPQTINRIADEGFNHGQVADTLEYLSDQIGGRMTNSPAMRKAETWTEGRF